MTLDDPQLAEIMAGATDEQMAALQVAATAVSERWPKDTENFNRLRILGAALVITGANNFRGLGWDRQIKREAYDDATRVLEGAILASPHVSAREIARQTGVARDTVNRVRGAKMNW